MTYIPPDETSPRDAFSRRATAPARARAGFSLSKRRWLGAAVVPVAVVFTLIALGCSSEAPPARRSGGGSVPRRTFTPMAGQESFFDNRILAEVHVGTEGMPEPQRGDSDRADGPRGGRRGGGGRMRMAVGPGSYDGDVGGGVPLGEGARPGRAYGGPRPGAMGGGGRPVMIHLRFTNRTEAPVELTITDFVSPLGNFVVRPDKLKLAPGESMETDPMTSQLAGAYAEATAVLVLRLEEKPEKKAFTLKQVAPPEKQPD